jgi:hypothetical protein
VVGAAREVLVRHPPFREIGKLRAGQCEFFRKRSGDATHAIWETKRRGDPRIAEWEFTIEEAAAAMLGDYNRQSGKFNPEANWSKWPKNMCSWRAATFLAREEWAEVVGDFLTPEEVGDMGGRPTFDAVGEAA